MRNHLASTTHPNGMWVAGSLKSCMRSGKGCSIGSGVFTHVVLTKTLGALKAREIWERVYRRLDLWERGIHAVLVGYVLEEVRSSKGHVERREEEE